MGFAPTKYKGDHLQNNLGNVENNLSPLRMHTQF